MIPTTPSVAASEREEDELYSYLLRRGWSVEYVGQRVWSQGLKTAARHYSVARHWPDLLIGRGPTIYFVEVVNTGGRREPFLEVAKLVALNRWMDVAPVLIADVSTKTAWLHNADWPDRDLATNVMTVHPNGGSGDPYCALIRPEYAATWDVTFA